jgi:hypothetical protein
MFKFHQTVFKELNSYRTIILIESYLLRPVILSYFQPVSWLNRIMTDDLTLYSVLVLCSSKDPGGAMV